jgi:hypothetical protein
MSGMWETLRNDQGQAKGSTKRNTKKRADVVYSDANPLQLGSKQPRRETTKGVQAGVSDPGGVAVAQKADKDDEEAYSAGNSDARTSWSSTGIVGAFQPTFLSGEHSRTGTDGDSLLRENLMVDSSSKSSTQTSSLPATVLSVENGTLQAESQPYSKGDDTAVDQELHILEEELHILEEELKNENQSLWEEDEKLHADVVHKTTREATASASGTFSIELNGP